MAEESKESLEHQLRSMILGNVTIAQAPSHHHHHRGRGRDHGRNASQHGKTWQGRAQGRGGSAHDPSTSTSEHNNDASPYANGSSSSRGRGHALDRAQDRGRGRNAVKYDQPVSRRPMPQGRGGSDNVSWRGQQENRQQSGDHDPMNKMQAPTIMQRPQSQVAFPHANGQVPQPTHSGFRSNSSYSALAQQHEAQGIHLERLAQIEIPNAEMSLAELQEKETFRLHLQEICQAALAATDSAVVDLLGFGSLASGFATPGSDMDLAVVPRSSHPIHRESAEVARNIPRELEGAILRAGMGARLLTRTRVPILKVCQRPTKALYNALCEERGKWEALPEDQQYEDASKVQSKASKAGIIETEQKFVQAEEDFPSLSQAGKGPRSQGTQRGQPSRGVEVPQKRDVTPVKEKQENDQAAFVSQQLPSQQPPREKRWVREKTMGPLDFPKEGVGFQCDLNFGNALGLHNTHLLRCYSLCDPRIRPFVLFVKSWAKRRKVNSSYSGTLSSYGWVLMVLHYLVNVAQPPVCPNLQIIERLPISLVNAYIATEHGIQGTFAGGYAVRFWHNEDEIIRAAQSGLLTTNRQALGALLRGFFHYYAALPRFGQETRSFHWVNEVLSLRTPGGIRSKRQKNWTGATTVQKNGTEVRNRYLFCIEDPFEVDHNVARTVTHFGIVAIRDEFRRASRILDAIGTGHEPEGGLFDEIVEEAQKLQHVHDASSADMEHQAAASQTSTPAPTKPPQQSTVERDSSLA